MGDKILKIKWQRLVYKGKTCPRCSLTEKEIDNAFSVLRQSCAPLGIQVRLEKTKLSLLRFKKRPSESNRIWINNRPLENWLKANAGKSQCCDVCGPAECRILDVKGKKYEAIPAELIVQAGLLAATKMK
ncbi:MAG: DUF2703 domain-containing protein [Candidatus Omnitrophica bacterium]|nr:DUF2703 domain-containing protein [Candidatus Omnitrophota bacterium]